MKSETIYIDGKFVNIEKASVSVFDRGLNYGDGLFETMKAYNGRVFLFAEHLKRLSMGSRELSIRSKLLKEISNEAGPVSEILKRNGLEKNAAYIKIVITRGTSGEGHLPGNEKESSCTIIITARAANEELIKRYQSRGVNTVLIEAPLRAYAHIKSLNYLPSVLGKIEAKKRKAYEAIFTNKEEILEGSATNIFIVEDNTIKTPPDDGAILPGITRGEVLRLAERGGLRVVTGPITTTALLKADEAFLTNSIIEIIPLVSVNSALIAGGKPGALTRRLQKLYREETARK